MSVRSLEINDTRFAVIQIIGGAAAAVGNSQIGRVFHVQRTLVHVVLQREIGLEIVVTAYGVLLTIQVTPVLAVSASVLVYLLL